MNCVMRNFPSVEALSTKRGFALWDLVLQVLLFASVLMLYCPNLVRATIGEWTSNGPEGGRIYSLAIDRNNPKTVYAGTYGSGVFKSTDGGANWSATGLTDAYVNALAIDPDDSNNVYAGAHGVFKSSDGGAKWSAVNTGLGNINIDALAIDPTNPTILYAGNWGSGIFKSTNSGANWSLANNGLTNTNILALAIDRSDSNIVYAGSRYGGVFKSTDGGANWGAINAGLTDTIVNALAIDPNYSNILYAGSRYGVVFKSTNGGADWSETKIGPIVTYVASLAVDPTNSNIVYAGTCGNGSFKSTDGGANWSGVGLTNDRVLALAIDPTHANTLWVGTDGGGVFKSTNGGAKWSAVNTGLIATFVEALAIDTNDFRTVYAGTYGGGVFKSTNGGTSWSVINTGLTNTDVYAFAIDPNDSSTVYAGTWGRGAFKSTNGGTNWSSTGPAYTDVYAFAIDRNDSNTVYAGTYRGGVFKSINGGTSWSAINTGLTDTYVHTLAIDPNDSNTVYAGTSDAGVFKSINGGTSWSAINTGLTNTDVWALAVDQNDSSTVYAGTWQGGAFKSTNGGTNWSSIGPNHYNVHALAIDPNDSKTVYAGTHLGVFKSINGGTSWSAINTGLKDTYVRALAIDATGNALYAGTFAGGVFKSPDGYVVSGTVTSGGVGLGGVTVNLTGAASKNTTTDTKGNYSFPGLSDGAYTITPSKSGYSFNPSSISMSVEGVDVPDQDFAVSASTYSASGKVTSGGVGLAGVALDLTGAATQTTTTGSDGTYSFTGLADGVYIVTPKKGSFSFSPQSHSFNINVVNVTGQDFILESGSLKVKIIPKGAAIDGARWKVDNGIWRISGATIARLPVGQHTVAFKGIPGWVTPAKETVNIVAEGAGLATGIYQALGAGFTAAPISGKAPLKVQFTDQSTGPVAGWLWDFGDSTTSTKRQPIHIYTKPGTYTVTLTVKKGNCTSTLTKADYIVVYQGPDCRIPGIPSSPSPANGASEVNPTSLKLTWAPASDATEYEVYFGTSPDLSRVATVSTPGYTPPTLSPGVTYYWGIAAKNSCAAATSMFWTFSTSDPEQP